MKLHVVEIEKSHPGLRKDTPGDFTKDEMDMIAHHFNSHEKSKDIIFEVARQAIAEYDINAPPLTKNRFANNFVDKLDQALSEAEKP